MPREAGIVELVRRVVREWDPLGLLAGGAPEDEWDGEVKALVKQVPRIRSEKDAAHAVSRVFSSLDRDRFTPDGCSEVGRVLYLALREVGVVMSDNALSPCADRRQTRNVRRRE